MISPTFEPVTYGEFIFSNYIGFLVVIIKLPALLASMVITEQYLLNGQTNWWQALRRGLSRWFVGFGTATLAGFLAVLGFIFFVIPGLVFVTRIYFFNEAIVLRHLGGSSALSYSRSLVEGRWWKVFIVIVVTFINSVLLIIIFNLTLSTASVILSVPATTFFIGIISRFFTHLLVHYNILVGTIFFINLEHRKN